MRIVVIGDTHGQHWHLPTLSGDVLIHCGDLCNADDRGRAALGDLDAWFAEQRFERIFCVGGNHDFAMQAAVASGRLAFKHAQHLQDELVEYRGVTFYGAPWVPDLTGWAFYADRENLRRAWRKVPTGIDVLITHTPPHGILDLPTGGTLHAGCVELAAELQRIRPAIHCFGHIHASYGMQSIDGTTYINAASVGRGMQLKNPPVELSLDR